MTNVAPGWYPDPSGSGAQRWWDGTNWTDHSNQPYAQSTVGLRAPEGAKTNTVWIWLVVVLPLVGVLPLLFIDWRSTLDLSSPTGSTALMTSPLYLFSGVLSWVLYGLVVFFAYRDYRALEAAGVPRPFHWAFAFLSSVVYAIGRAVVVKRRTGHGSAVLWAAIASIVLSFVFVTIVMVQLFGAILSEVQRYS
jgi:hypothetical protein